MKKLIPVAILIILVLIALVWWSFMTVLPSDPLVGSSQLVLVVTRTRSASTGKLWAFDRDGDTWRAAFAEPVVLGRNGLAWGRGLHSDRDRGKGDEVKREGDGCSPEGAFELLSVYGYQHPRSIGIDFPYEQITPDLVCIDDVTSEYYNLIVPADSAGIRMDSTDAADDSADASPVSHEMMRRDDDLYRYLVLVGHNLPDPVPGAGSCIFLHIWRGRNEPTAGCTAMAEPVIVQILSWLEKDKSPRLVQLSRKNYMRLKHEWGLPEVIP